jgi:transposase
LLAFPKWVASINVKSLPWQESHHFDRQSGAWRGPGTIRGGGAEVRTELYMATLTAVRHQPALRALYQRLHNSDKPAKVALVAAIHKLLAFLNVVLKRHTPGNPHCHTAA